MTNKTIRPEIRERILSAAESLAAEGIAQPTNSQVLERMGRGSLTHVSPVMREWRATRQKDSAPVFAMPDTLKTTLETSLGQLWVHATKLAHEQTENVRAEAHRAVSAIESERDEALNEIQRLESLVGDLREQLTEKRESEKRLEAKLDHLQSQYEAVSNERSVLSATIHERDARLKELKKDLTDSRSECRDLQKQLIALAKDAG